MTGTLQDGTYDAIVVDAREADTGSMTLDLTITAGPHKGDVVTVHAQHLTLTAVETLGLPADLIVTGGSPRLVLHQ